MPIIHVVIDEQLKDRRAQRQAHIHQLGNCGDPARKKILEAKLQGVEKQIHDLTAAGKARA